MTNSHSFNNKPKTPSPFCIRLSGAEKLRLKAAAKGKPLSVYARSRLLGDAVEKRRMTRKPKADDVLMAKLLLELGQSRLSSNLNQIAKAANMGALPVTPDLISDLTAACAAVTAMRRDLLLALGLKSGGEE